MTALTILGAGAMGSALATPLVDAGHEVRLWGTHLDNHLIDAVRAGRPHPRTDVCTPDSVASYYHGDLAAALDGCEIAVIAVASGGVADIAALAAPMLTEITALMLTSKGFAADAGGRMQLLPQIVEEQLTRAGVPPKPLVAIGGPCKANEVAARRPTAPIFGHPTLAKKYARLAFTDAYRVAGTEDRDGLEICAALKNVYAIALGVADGMGEASDAPFHDLKSAIFAQGLAELRLLLEAADCDPWTALGLAGAGDLEVTGLSGRNKLYGVRLGRGQEAGEALAEMEAAEQTVEGVAACDLARMFIDQRFGDLRNGMPLLCAIYSAVHEGGPTERIVDAALPQR